MSELNFDRSFVAISITHAAAFSALIGRLDFQMSFGGVSSFLLFIIASTIFITFASNVYVHLRDRNFSIKEILITLVFFGVGAVWLLHAIKPSSEVEPEQIYLMFIMISWAVMILTSALLLREESV